MSRLTQSDALAGVLAGTLMLLAGFLDLAEYGGAHPFWSSSVVYIGVPVGIIFAGVIRALGLGRGARLVLYAALLAVAIWVAYSGKTQFAASYAEDAFAGRMWYFGWIAIAAFGTALLARLFSRA